MAGVSLLYGYNYFFHIINYSYLNTVVPSSVANRIGISEPQLDKNSHVIGSLASARNNSNLDLPRLFKQSQDSVVQITAIHGTESSENGNRLGLGFVYNTNRHIVTISC